MSYVAETRHQFAIHEELEHLRDLQRLRVRDVLLYDLGDLGGIHVLPSAIEVEPEASEANP